MATCLVAVGITVSLFIGEASIDGATIEDALFHYDSDCVPHILIRDGRLPRALADVLVGAALAVAGAIMQAMTRNPLASPGIMGLNTGAGFFTVLTMALVPSAGPPQLLLASIAGAAFGASLVYGLAACSQGGMTPVRLALTGIAVSAMLGAVGNGFMIYFELGQDVLFWHARGTEGVPWLCLGLFFPLAFAALLGAFAIAPSLNILMVSDPVARGLGQRTKSVKFMGSVIVLVLAGGAVSLAGPVGFIGLLIPHLVRYLVGFDHRWVIPISAICGALLMLAADIGARLTSVPFKISIPVGVVMALIGVPFFLYLACRRPTIRSDRGTR